ncbi:MAG: helix-turn-helix transcriptional regulator [Spiribacter salinus]|uniref:Helix-turn-helix transcriptional regulator n=1 Tax=Spiribacter salinus TaxID=1335746 RepID=A0A540VQP7_9GAMM|nr:MAG: helix-turn-helix transcriptional regulator [Spiribacter salinus]
MQGENHDSGRDLMAAFGRLRRRNPELDRQIRETERRRALATALVGIRRRAGKTRREVAEAVGRDQAFISRLESTAGTFPSAKSIDDYARACGAMAGYVFAMPQGNQHIVFTAALGSTEEAAIIEQVVQGGGRR